MTGQTRLIATEPSACDLCGGLLNEGAPVVCTHKAQFCSACFTRLGSVGEVIPHQRECPDCGAAVWERRPRRWKVYG